MKINFDDPNEVFNSISPKLPKWIALLFYKFENLQNEKSLYYYTDMQALVNGIIVPSPEKGREICLWATKYSHLNDRQENKVGLNLLHKMLGKMIAFLIYIVNHRTTIIQLVSLEIEIICQCGVCMVLRVVELC